MGQSSSRNRNRDPPVASSSYHDTISANSSSSSAGTDSTLPNVATAPKQPYRSSVRRSLLNLVKHRPSHSVGSRVDNADYTSRRSWRNSRRWSKTRTESSDPAESSQSSQTQDFPPSPIAEKDAEQEIRSIESSQEAADRPSTPFPPPSAESPSESSTDGLSRVEQEASQNIGSWLGGQGGQGQGQGPGSAASLAHRLGLSRHPSGSEVEPEDEVVIGPEIFDPPAEAHADTTTPPDGQTSPPHTPSEPPAGQSAPAQQPQSRQFPPPGTLVVVQGVVHTTDVPRPSPSETTSPPSTSEPPVAMQSDTDIRRRASSTPRPSTPAGNERAGARNRLSALLRPRPTSMLGSRPSSFAGESSRTSLSPLGQSAPMPETPPPNETPVSSDPPSNPINNSNTSSGDAETSTPTTESRTPGAISSSSIDVLGTLLSVAAAATAASLLTGSSEPILSSGLAPPSSASSIPASSTPQSLSRPTSPTPTAGLGSLAAVNDSAAHGRGDRVRHAWGSIRERLGLRAPAAASSTDPGSGLGIGETNPRASISRNRPDGTPMDAREMMLAEMARAFNLGLGLTSDPSGETAASNVASGDQTPSQQSGDGAAQPNASRQLPPEGSFERFLVDLQADLRVALTQDSSLTREDAAPRVDAIVNPSTVQPPTAEVDTASAADESVVPTIVSDDRVSSPPHAELAEENDDEMPPLADVSDSETEFDEDDDLDDNEDFDEEVADNDIPALAPNSLSGSNSTPGSSQHPPITSGASWPLSALNPNATGTPPVQSGPEHNTPGRINWWRLYRFPPIAAPRAQGLSESLNNTSSPSSPLVSTPPEFGSPDPTPPSTDSSTPSSSTQVPPPPLPPTTEARSNVVIPVIVVGLQSVNMNWRRNPGAPGAPGEDEDVFAAAEGGDPDNNLAEDADFDGFPSQPEVGADNVDGNARPGTPRGRRWHSRAANAIRNLRPGRRGGARGTQPTDGAGSRTFLIYVIGGYYPPDHSIVTGGPNNLDSFEALLELAELLGQVKPPTVSKEDIEKSGLEIIKPAQLEQHEKEGKISSNCIERCLICLDDYEPEEDIRVLTCRHAFHKNCVDKWLQTGRNNCPACRSKGVSTDPASSLAQAAAEA